MRHSRGFGDKYKELNQLIMEPGMGINHFLEIKLTNGYRQQLCSTDQQFTFLLQNTLNVSELNEGNN